MHNSHFLPQNALLFDVNQSTVREHTAFVHENSKKKHLGECLAVQFCSHKVRQLDELGDGKLLGTEGKK